MTLIECYSGHLCGGGMGYFSQLTSSMLGSSTEETLMI